MSTGANPRPLLPEAGTLLTCALPGCETTYRYPDGWSAPVVNQDLWYHYCRPDHVGADAARRKAKTTRYQAIRRDGADTCGHRHRHRHKAQECAERHNRKMTTSSTHPTGPNPRTMMTTRPIPPETP